MGIPGRNNTMRISDILRGLADAIEQQDHDVISKPVEKHTDEPSIQDLGKFQPPLQQKHELLKKAVDVDSEFDKDSEEPQELTIIKKLAGLLHSDDMIG